MLWKLLEQSFQIADHAEMCVINTFMFSRSYGNVLDKRVTNACVQGLTLTRIFPVAHRTSNLEIVLVLHVDW